LAGGPGATGFAGKNSELRIFFDRNNSYAVSDQAVDKIGVSNRPWVMTWCKIDLHRLWVLEVHVTVETLVVEAGNSFRFLLYPRGQTCGRAPWLRPVLSTSRARDLAITASAPGVHLLPYPQNNCAVFAE
jgi:hypothetical protein